MVRNAPHRKELDEAASSTGQKSEVESVRELIWYISRQVVKNRSTTLNSPDDFVESLLPAVLASLRDIYQD